MSNCYPKRIKKTGEIQKSLCEDCVNQIKIKFIKTSPFWTDDLMKVQAEIENKTIQEHNQGCKYLNLGHYHYTNIDCIIVTECNQYKTEKILKIKGEFVNSN